VEAFNEVSDTRSVAAWDFAPEHVHLIGMRRGAGISWKIRINNDVFVLLVNGGYINHHKDLIDCWQYAAATYTQLPNLTRAADNVLLDLITIFSKNTSVSKGDLLHYTLINESDLDLEPSIGALSARDILKQGLQILAANDRQKYNQYKDLLA
jgi:hypothetical protein